MARLSDTALMGLVRKLLETSGDVVSKHVAAMVILDAMDRSGYDLSMGLISAVTNHDDSVALEILKPPDQEPPKVRVPEPEFEVTWAGGAGCSNKPVMFNGRNLNITDPNKETVPQRVARQEEWDRTFDSWIDTDPPNVALFFPGSDRKKLYQKFKVLNLENLESSRKALKA